MLVDLAESPSLVVRQNNEIPDPVDKQVGSLALSSGPACKQAGGYRSKFRPRN